MKERKMSKNIIKETFKTYFANFFSYLSYSLLFTFFILIGLGASYFVPPLLVFFIIFLFIPSGFALHFSVVNTRRGEPFNLGLFFKGFGLYYNPFFRGGYCSIRNIVFSLVLFLGLTIVIFVPFEMYEIYHNKELYEMVMNVDALDYEAFSNLIFNNQTIMDGFMISFNVAGLISSLLFFHLHLRRSLIVNNQLYVKHPESMGMAKHFGGYQLKLFTKQFYKEYLKIIYLPLIIYLLGFALGFFIHFKFLGTEPGNLLGFSYVFGAIFLIPIYPFISIYLDNIIYFNLNDFIVCHAKSVIYNLNRLARFNLGDEEKEMVDKLINEANEIINKNNNNKQ